MTGKVLRQIAVQDLSEQDIFWLIKATATSYTGAEPKHIMADAAQGLMQLWRVGEEEGLIVTQLLHHPAGNELHVWSMAGRGIIPRIEDIYQDLLSMAKEHNCRWIGGSPTSPGLERVYERVIGATQWASRYLKEIDHD